MILCLSALWQLAGHPFIDFLSSLEHPFLLSHFGCSFCLFCWFVLAFLSREARGSVLRSLVYLGDLLQSCGFACLRVPMTPTLTSPAWTIPLGPRLIHPAASSRFPLNYLLGISNLSYPEVNSWGPPISIPTCLSQFFLLVITSRVAQANNLEALTSLTPFFLSYPTSNSPPIMRAISWKYSQNPTPSPRLSCTLVQPTFTPCLDPTGLPAPSCPCPLQSVLNPAARVLL